MVEQGTEPKITVSRNGPYRVEGRIRLEAPDGHAIEAPSTPVLLCRCGGSNTKPFCDTTHVRLRFNGTEVADRGPIAERQKVYQGHGITIYDDRSVCSHAGFCTDNLAQVFKLHQEPWIDPLGATAEAISAVIRQCPSGALSYSLGDSSEPVEERSEPTVTVSKDGPYWLKGAVQVRSPDGSTYEPRNRSALCRCGGSKNKPFCDGTHWHIGFKHG